MKKTIIPIVILGIVLVGYFYLQSQTIANSTPEQKLEQFLTENNATGDVAKAYRIALANPQGILDKVICYCGCLQQGHKNNRDCFFKDDGSFDLMGLNCGLCVKTAIVSDQMLKEGKNIEEIAQYIDQKYGNLD